MRDSSNEMKYTDEIPRLSIAKIETGLYRYEVSCEGQTLYEAEGQSGIAEAIMQAIDTEPRFAGFEVAYDGYLVGTYTFSELLAESEAVSVAAVRTKAKFWQP